MHYLSIKTILNYFLEIVASSKGIIITNVIITEGLKSQYKRPKEKITIQNSFLCNISIIIK
tara:strand:- start:101 stop:283 length:183 start_codon:yes stop_codon:yes gene_type:complete